MREHEQEKDILRRAVFLKRSDPKLQKQAAEIGEMLVAVCTTGSWKPFDSREDFDQVFLPFIGENQDAAKAIALMVLLDTYGPLQPWQDAFKKWAGWSLGLWDRVSEDEAIEVQYPLFYFDPVEYEVSESFRHSQYDTWYDWQITGSPRTWVNRSVLARIEELIGAIDPVGMIDNAPLISAKITIDAWIKDARLSIALS